MTSRQNIIDLALKVFESPDNSTELLPTVNNFILESGGNLETFGQTRLKKLARNGGFTKGFVQSEKVLPIGKDAEVTKLRRDTQRDVQTGAEKVLGEMNAQGIWPMIEKLVRDNIPEITENQARLNGLINYRAKVRVAEKSELKELLHKKFLEDSIEFLVADESDGVFEELGDLLDIVDAYQKLT